jgi:hypothetical protein
LVLGDYDRQHINTKAYIRTIHVWNGSSIFTTTSQQTRVVRKWKRVIRRLPLMEQDPLTFPKHMNHLVLVFADPLVSCVVFLSFLFRLLYCLFVVTTLDPFGIFKSFLARTSRNEPDITEHVCKYSYKLRKPIHNYYK